MSDKIKVKPLEGQKFKEIEVSTKNWNLDTRKEINKLVTPILAEENMEIKGNMMFNAGCDILEMATTLTEQEIFELSSAEIIAIGFRISDEINKKKLMNYCFVSMYGFHSISFKKVLLKGFHSLM